MEEINPYVSSWEGKGKNNHISQLTKDSTYYTAQPGRQLDYYYIRPQPTQVIENSAWGRSPPQSTYSNLVNSYVIKGAGNFPISTPRRGSSQAVLPQENRGVRPIFQGETIGKPRPAIDLARENVYVYTSPSSGAMGGGNGQYPVYLGSNSPSTHYGRSNEFTSIPPGSPRVDRSLPEAGYQGSFSPSTKRGVIFGGSGREFNMTNRNPPRTGNVSLPTKNFASLKATAQMERPRSNWQGPGSLSGNYGVASQGNNSSYGGSSPGFSPSNPTALREQNLGDQIVKPKISL